MDKRFKKYMVRHLLCMASLLMGFQCLAVSFYVDGYHFNILTITETERTVELTLGNKIEDDATLVIPEKVTYVGDEYTVVAIGKEAFNNSFVQERVKYVSFPNTIKKIGEKAFYKCKKLESLTLPEKLDRIEDYTFYGCESLKSVTLPKELTTIAHHAFEECGSLQSIDLPEGLLKIGDNAFYHCSSISHIEIPDGVSYIGESALSGLALEEIIFPESVTFLGDYAVSSNKALKSVKLPSSLTSLPKGLFSNCFSLYTFDIPSNIREIGNYAFYMSGLRSITIPESVTEIGKQAFQWCEELKEVTILEGLTVIGEMAFDGCYQLKEVTIPASVQKIVSRAFSYCFALTEFNIDERNQYFSSYGGMLFNKDQTILYFYPSARGDVVLPEGIKIIGSAFYGCSIHAVTIPATVVQIYDRAFASDAILTPEFVYCYPLTPPEISELSFTYEDYYKPKDGVKFYVPAESLELYKTSPNWSYFENRIYPMEGDTNVDTVDMVEDEESYSVFSIDGKRMMQTVNAEDLHTLAKGLYIVNGKKVLIK